MNPHLSTRKGNVANLPRLRVRRGAATLEFALVIPIYTFILLSVIFGGIRVYQSEQYTAMAKCLARMAIVRGKKSDILSPWGPSTLQGYVGDGSPIGTSLANKFTGGRAANIFFQLEWPDQGNDPSRGDRVKATISSWSISTAPPPSSLGFLNLNSNVSASVTLEIVH